ncbi:MAG: hypothetical protein IH965_08705 [Gemmatimonadetes bacterium]|nr:hypothetical protein [Gemmatimonadota bacterium]
MLRNKVRALVPIVALVLAAACSDPIGPTAPDLQEVEEASIDDQGEEADGSQTKRNTPLDQ